MLINCIFLAISSSIDSLGIGITYGIRNIKISFASKFILLAISIFISFISVCFGSFLTCFLPDFFTNFFASFILFIIAFIIIIKSLFDKKTHNNSYFDFNHSNIIDPKESCFLSLALSLDSFGIGISSSLIGINPLFFTFFISIFQFVFLNFGIWIGYKIKKYSNIPNFVWSFISAFLLFAIRTI